jgi:hypothetical protein
MRYMQGAEIRKLGVTLHDLLTDATIRSGESCRAVTCIPVNTINTFPAIITEEKKT